MRSNINNIRKEILFLKNKFLKSSISKRINIHLSSLISFRYLIFLNLNPKRNLETEILRKNIFYQLKKFFYIRKFSTIEFFGDFSHLKKNEKKKLLFLGLMIKILKIMAYIKIPTLKFLVKTKSICGY